MRYQERLSAPWRWWVIPVFFLWTLWLAVWAALGNAWAVPATVLGTAIVFGTLARYSSAVIRVDDGMLTAGPARIPLGVVGEVRPLAAQAARELRGVKADARAFLLLRGYISTAVRVDIVDPDDPTPYAYLSTRRPAELAGALTAARDAARGAARDTTEGG